MAHYGSASDGTLQLPACSLKDRLDLMIDVVIERTADTILTEAIDGMHKGQFILWAADGSRVIRVGTKDFAKNGTSLSIPSPRHTLW